MGSVAAERSMLDVLASWKAAGYVAAFSVSGTAVRCGECRQLHDPGDVQIVDVARFEGISDPDDEAIAFALVCRQCGARGALVGAYGPMASTEEATVMTALQDTRAR